jgi:hypothetical protein
MINKTKIQIKRELEILTSMLSTIMLNYKVYSEDTDQYLSNAMDNLNNAIEEIKTQ